MTVLKNEERGTDKRTNDRRIIHGLYATGTAG
jgi:hypothetical protein